MSFKVVLIDVNPKMIEAWRASFEENPEVDIVQGSLLDQKTSAWVTPGNSRGSMGAGLDRVIRQHLGDRIQTKLQAEIQRLYLGVMPIGCAVCVPTDMAIPKYLISAPVMGPTSDRISDTLNVALACAAALQAAHVQHRRDPASIDSVALPGMGTGVAGVPFEIAADLMWSAYNLLKEREFTDFFALRVALEEQFGDLGPMTGQARPKRRAVVQQPPGPTPPPVAPPPQTPSVKNTDIDFDDA